jgi:hypothetical protein
LRALICEYELLLLVCVCACARTHVRACVQCVRVSDFPDAGASSCTLCPSGQYQTFDGRTKCENCPTLSITQGVGGIYSRARALSLSRSRSHLPLFIPLSYLIHIIARACIHTLTPHPHTHTHSHPQRHRHTITHILMTCKHTNIGKGMNDCVCVAGYYRSGANCLPCPRGAFKAGSCNDACQVPCNELTPKPCSD